MKRILSILLAAALAFTLALPAFADGEPDPAMPVITMQPVGQSTDRLRTNYDGLSLRVYATIPNGDPISYRWYRNGVAVDSHDYAFCSFSESEPGDYYYYVEVYNRDNPEYFVTSETIQVEYYRAPFVWLFAFLGGIPNRLGSLLWLILSPITGLLPLVLSIPGILSFGLFLLSVYAFILPYTWIRNLFQ